MADIILAVSVCSLMAGMGFMGVYVTLHSPVSEREKNAWKLGFLVLAAVACVLVGWQVRRSNRAQDSLQYRLDNMLKPPTAEQNAAAIVALQEQHTSQKNQQQIKGATAQPSKPKPTAPRHEKPLPIAPPPAQPLPQQTSNPPPPVPPVAQFTVTQSADVSDRTEMPYKTRVVVQSSAEFPALKLAIQCDGPLTEGRGGIIGVSTNVRFGIVAGHPEIFIYTYGSAVPIFGPANPLIFTFWSKQPIRCIKASTF